METTEGSMLCVTHGESARQPHRGVAQTLSTEDFSDANISAALRELHCNLTEGLQSATLTEGARSKPQMVLNCLTEGAELAP